MTDEKQTSYRTPWGILSDRPQNCLQTVVPASREKAGLPKHVWVPAQQAGVQPIRTPLEGLGIAALLSHCESVEFAITVLTPHCPVSNRLIGKMP